jgi:hypothetical protein
VKTVETSRALRLATTAMAVAAVVPPAIGAAQRVGMSQEQSQRSTRAFVQCMVANRKQLSEQYLGATEPADFAKWRDRLWDNVRCNLPGFPGTGSGFRSFTMPIDVERGLVAEQLILTGRVTPPTEPAKPATPAPYQPRWAAVTGRAPAVDEMADCVAANDPGGVVALLRSDADSDAEKAAFAALGEKFGQCLVSGATLKANRLSMRAALAEALYQRAASPAFNSTAGIQ